MVRRHNGRAVEWYNRAVLGVIAMSLARLAGQTACGVETVARAQFTCGSQSNPCHVIFATDDSLIYHDELRNERRLKILQ